VVYSSGCGGLCALNASTGELLWQHAGAGGSLAVANGVVYAGSHGGGLYAFDLAGGLYSDKFSLPERPDPMLLVPDYSLQPSTTRMPSDSQ
jgi:outer membrane protein assembly factor BamB